MSSDKLVVEAAESESGGTGFDSRRARVIFGPIFCHVGVTFVWILGHVGNGWGMFWDGFGKVAKGSKHFENLIFQKCLGVFVPRRGHQNKRFGHTPGPTNPKTKKSDLGYLGGRRHGRSPLE